MEKEIKPTKKQIEMMEMFNDVFGERYLGYAALSDVLKMYDNELDLSPKVHKKIDELIKLIRQEAFKEMKK